MIQHFQYNVINFLHILAILYQTAILLALNWVVTWFNF